MEPAEAKKQQRHQLPKKEELPPQVLLAMEREVVGLYVSGHPLTRYQDRVQQWKTKLIVDINGEEYPDGSLVEVLCIIESRKNKATRSGETMACDGGGQHRFYRDFDLPESFVRVSFSL